MLHPEPIQQQVILALQTAQRSTPPVLEALQLLGIRNSSISEWAGVSPSLVSRWCSSKDPIALTHTPRLLELLRLAYQAAIQELGQVAARSNPPDIENSFETYRRRARRVGEILAELDRS